MSPSQSRFSVEGKGSASSPEGTNRTIRIAAQQANNLPNLAKNVVISIIENPDRACSPSDTRRGKSAKQSTLVAPELLPNLLPREFRPEPVKPRKPRPQRCKEVSPQKKSRAKTQRGTEKPLCVLSGFARALLSYVFATMCRKCYE